jgi:hypothetical protein
MKVTKTIQRILSNKMVLNGIFAVAFINLICFVICGKEKEIILFLLLGFLTSCFSKNMIVVLSVPLVLVNFLSSNNVLREGMGSKSTSSDDDDDDDDVEDINNDNKVKTLAKKKKGDEGSVEPSAANESVSSSFTGKKKKNEIDYATTVEEAYENLGNIIGGKGMEKLGGETQDLLKYQEALTQSMKSIEPLVQNVEPLMEKMGGIINSLGGAEGMSKFANIAAAFTPSKKKPKSDEEE